MKDEVLRYKGIISFSPRVIKVIDRLPKRRVPKNKNGFINDIVKLVILHLFQRIKFIFEILIIFFLTLI